MIRASEILEPHNITLRISTNFNQVENFGNLARGMRFRKHVYCLMALVTPKFKPVPGYRIHQRPHTLTKKRITSAALFAAGNRLCGQKSIVLFTFVKEFLTSYILSENHCVFYDWHSIQSMSIADGENSN